MLASLRVVLSDDEAPLVRALGRLFRRQGVETIDDLEGAVVSIAEQSPPDLILLDLHQGTSGLELLRELKANPRTQEVSVVMMSGDDSPRERAAALAAGADGFLLKPFDLAEVEGLILKLRKARGE